MHGLGRVYMEPKGHIVLDRYQGEWEVMPSYIEEPEAAACKWVSIREDNAKYELPAVFSILIYTHPETGFPLAICDGSFHTLMRTGASAAVSARWLARKDSKVLAVLGTGSVGRGHARHLRRGLRLGGRPRLEPDAGVGRPLPRERGAEVPAPEAGRHDGRPNGGRGRRRDRHRDARARVARRRRVGQARRAHRGAGRRPEGRAGARPAHPAAWRGSSSTTSASAARTARSTSLSREGLITEDGRRRRDRQGDHRRAGGRAVGRPGDGVRLDRDRAAGLRDGSARGRARPSPPVSASRRR